MRHRPADLPAVLGERGGPLVRRLAELLRAIEQGRRSCSPANLDLLAAHERLERLGRPLNAVCSVIGAPDRARTGPLAGRPVGVKDIIAVAGVPTRCGSPASDPRPAAGGRGPGAPPAGSRGRGVRDHPVPGVRGGVRASRGRRHAQPPRPVPYLGRIVRRVGGARRGGRVRPGSRHRHRRLGADPGRVLRGRRAQAELRAAPAGGGLPALAQLRPRGHAHRHRGRRRGPAGRPGRGRQPGRARPAPDRARRRSPSASLAPS